MGGHPHISWNAGVLALSAALAAQGAMAQDLPLTQEHPIMLRLENSVFWDSNVFRVPTGSPDPQGHLGKPGKSDLITTMTVGLRLDKSYAQQNFVLDVSQTATRYAKFTSLDHEAFQYQGAWLWSLTPRLRGSLTFEHTEAQIPFSDLRTAEPNLRTSDKHAFNVDFWAFGGWHLLGGAFNNAVRTSREFLAQPSYTTSGGDIGVRYEAMSGSSITAAARAYRGTSTSAVDLVNVIDNAFRVREGEVKAIWLITGKSALSGRLTRFEQRHDHLPQRDFSGTTGEFSHLWEVSGRLRMDFSVSRSVLPWTGDTQASYRIDDRISFAPSLQVSERIIMRMLAFRLVSDFPGPVAPLAAPARRDVLSSAWLGVEWSPPVRNLLVTGSVQHARRSSNIAGFDFDNTQLLLSATMKF